MTNSSMVRVWDLPTRIFHWGLVGMFAFVWITGEADGWLFWLHVYGGTALLGFVVFRIIWGIIGSRHAQFRNFVRGPNTVKAYGKALIAFKPPHMTGHNPLGGWMVVTLLLVITAVVFTGLMSSEDDYVGPLAHVAGAGLLGEAHEGIAHFLLILIGVHVVGAIAHGLISKENLVRAMWTGDKTKNAVGDASPIAPVGLIRPLFALAVGIASVVYFLR